MAKDPTKTPFKKKFGERTAFDLDYGKLFLTGLFGYIPVRVS